MSRIDKGRAARPAAAKGRIDPVVYAWQRSNGRPIPPELLEDGRPAVSGMLEQRERPEKFWEAF